MLPKGESIGIVFQHGTGPVEIRHKHDGCWEIWTMDVDNPNVQDIIHIEEGDWPRFLAMVMLYGGEHDRLSTMPVLWRKSKP